MPQQERFELSHWLGLIVVLALAATMRFGYLTLAVDQGRGNPAWIVQGEGPRRDYPADTELRGHKNPTELDDLVHHLLDGTGFVGLAPLADSQEKTAHVAPGYYWLFAQISKLDVPADQTMRWIQAVLGVLTCGCYYLFARRAFGSVLVAFLTGIMAALHPFWVLNIAELQDGTLATFLLAAALALGARGAQAGGVFTSLVFGLSLGGLAMVRAALLPFAVVGVLWFLLRCRAVRLGWLCALLAFLGFGNVLAPWAVQTFKTFGEPMPIVDSTYLHLWIGNNPQATGGPLDEGTLRRSLEGRLDDLLKEPSQAKRYAQLAPLLAEEIAAHPRETFTRRIQAGLAFLLGEHWLRNRTMAQVLPASEESGVVSPPDWLEEWGEAALQGSLLLLLLVGFLGWRWSFGWRKQSRLAAIAMIWLPLPYLLSHADTLSSPRLPLDGVLMCFTAFAFAHLDPLLAREPRPEGDGKKKNKSA